MAPTLTTNRLTLRSATRGDFTRYATILAEPRMAYIGGPYGPGDAWSEFNKAIASWHLNGFGGWMITNRFNGDLLGEVAITQTHRYPEPELGWTLAANAEGQGYGFEAAAAARDWYWANMGGGTLVSYIDPANARSAALALRLGAHHDRAAAQPLGEAPGETNVYRHAWPANRNAQVPA